MHYVHVVVSYGFSPGTGSCPVPGCPDKRDVSVGDNIIVIIIIITSCFTRAIPTDIIVFLRGT